MATNLVIIENDSQFPTQLAQAGTKLVVVDFFATWCGPCTNIAPVFARLAVTYPNAIFMKVDVEKCQTTASSNGVSAMPTFIFFRNKTKIDSHRGADASVLEEKLKKWYSSGDDADEVTVKGHMDLSSFINKAGCECLNESNEHPLAHALTSKGGYLESDCDEQLLMSIEFNQTVKLHSLKIQAPAEKAPKTIKLFINQPKSVDFDSAENMDALQILELSDKDVAEGALVELRYVKFQSVNSITLFIKDNQNNTETTQIDYLGFIGSPGTATNMSEFKRVAGKKGESH